MSFLLSAGSNARGQLANGSLDDSHHFQKCSFYGYPTGTLPSQTRRIVNIATGANHTVALLERRSDDERLYLELWGCGDGSAGQLGAAYKRAIDSGESPAVFRVLDLSLDEAGLKGHHPKLIAAGWETTYVALGCGGKEDVLISMGSDDFGDLGIGRLDKDKGKAIKKTTKSFHIVELNRCIVGELSQKSEMTEITICSLAAGQHHVVAALAVRSNGGATKTCIVGWGASRHGQLGNKIEKGGRHPQYSPCPSILLVEDGNERIVDVALGSQHTVLLHSSGRVTPFGTNRKGQLQGLEGAKGVVKLDCTWNGTYLLARNGDQSQRLFATGSHDHGQLGRKIDHPNSPPSLEPVEWKLSSDTAIITDMACGTEHVLILVSESPKESLKVWGWGWNEHGNLGTGQTEDVFAPKRIWPAESDDRVQEATGIWAGSGTSWIYSETG